MRLQQFAQLGLDQHLSAQRSNGLRAMIARIQGVAQQNLAAAVHNLYDFYEFALIRRTVDTQAHAC